MSAATTPALRVNTDWYFDTAWDSLNDCLHVNITNRLKTADRALYALNRLSEMLFANTCGHTNAQADDVPPFTGLSPAEIEAIQIALIELGGIASGMLDGLRDNEHNCLRRTGGAA